MADQCPNKSDIQAIFKRLRNIPANKVCFDCNAKNPTWATVTYGVFICIDCSAVHRGLGVHLTFVRSTQLDTNWTWIQLRQMQLGGNANAKYNSRAAQLYREKLHQMAIQAMRVHGNKVHLDSTHEHNSANDDKKEVDFFEEIATSDPMAGFAHEEPEIPQVPKLAMNISKPKADVEDMGQPNLELAFNTDNLSSGATRKPTIGGRKPPAKKGGLGAKKGGLGAQRVKANFDDIEREAQIADEQKERAEEDAKKALEVKAEEEEKQIVSMRLAYQDLSVQQKKEEEKMKVSNPKKAEQMERLGMGFASRTGVSHSALSDMKTIEQEGVIENTPRSLSSSQSRSNVDAPDFFDEFNYSSGFSMYKGSRSSESKGMEWTMLDAPKESISDSSGARGWTDQEPRRTSSTNNYSSSSSSNSNSSSSRSRDSQPPPAAADGTEAQKKFGSAKAISSDQFFQDSRDNDWERKTNLSRFEGSSSISSSDYFSDGRSSNSGARSYNAQSSMQTPDLEDVKESMRQGVTKVASKLNSLANGVMSSIQERYGY
ncbi:hypothetical protein B566_EDAN006461 [Ephemera danica]|nr:hypothetical protein B566_EDAN006461 [Ephemera danica]